jgi:hypothetical protein
MSNAAPAHDTVAIATPAITGALPDGKFYMVRRGVPGSMTLLVGPFDAELATALPSDWEAARPGKIHSAAYRCRVNGDGFRYKAQEVLDGAGGVVGSIARYDLGTTEI